MSSEKRLIKDLESSMVFLTDSAPTTQEIHRVSNEAQITIETLEARIDRNLEETRKLKEEVIRLNMEGAKK